MEKNQVEADKVLLYTMENNSLVIVSDVNILLVLKLLYYSGFTHTLVVSSSSSLNHQLPQKLYASLKIDPNAVDATKIISCCRSITSNDTSISAIKLLTPEHFLYFQCNYREFHRQYEVILVDQSSFRDSDVCINIVISYLKMLSQQQPSLKIIILTDPSFKHSVPKSLVKETPSVDAELLAYFPSGMKKQYLQYSAALSNSNISFYLLSEPPGNIVKSCIQTLRNIVKFESDGDIVVFLDPSDILEFQNEVRLYEDLSQIPLLQLSDKDHYYNSRTHKRRILLINQNKQDFLNSLRIMNGHQVGFILDSGFEFSKLTATQALSVLFRNNNASGLKYFLLMDEATYIAAPTVSTTNLSSDVLSFHVPFLIHLGLNPATFRFFYPLYSTALIESLAELKLRNILKYNEDTVDKLTLTDQGCAFLKFSNLYQRVNSDNARMCEQNFKLISTLVSSIELGCFDIISKIISIVAVFDYYGLRDIFKFSPLISRESDVITILNFFQVAIDAGAGKIRNGGELELRKIFEANSLKRFSSFLRKNTRLLEQSHKVYNSLRRIRPTLYSHQNSYEEQEELEDIELIVKAFCTGFYNNSGEIVLQDTEPKVRIKKYNSGSDTSQYAIFTNEDSILNYQQGDSVFWINYMQDLDYSFVNIVTKVDKSLLVNSSSGVYELK